MIDNYLLCVSGEMQSLTERVNKFITLGWQPLGGPGWEVDCNVKRSPRNRKINSPSCVHARLTLMGC